MNEHTNPKHHIMKDQQGNPLYITIPYYEFLELKKERVNKESDEITIPHGVAKLILLEDYNIIKAWRKYKGLSQREMAEKMGIKQSSYSRHEKPGGKVGIDTLRRIAIAMDINVEQIVEGL